MAEANERTPLLKTGTKEMPMIKTTTKKMRSAVNKILAVRAIGGDNVSLFGDLTGKTADGSVDAIGAGVAMKNAAFHMLSPEDQIAHLRTLDPKAVKQAAAEAAELSGQKRWASISFEEVAREHGSTISGGLATSKVEELWETVGRNELAKGKKQSFLSLWFRSMMDVVSIVILIAGVVNVTLLEDPFTGGILISYFWVSTFINAIGEYNGSEGLSALNAMGAEQCKVTRDGVEKDVDATDLVPGDIVHVQCGDTCPADLRVATATDLRIDESVLTGEAEEMTKVVEPLSGEDIETFPWNMMYSSTAVVAGKGTGIVTATGMNAQVGLIAKRLDTAGPGLSPLQMAMNKLGGAVGVIVLTVTVFVTALCFITRTQDPDHVCAESDTKCFFWRSLAQGLILGISCVPVTMPMMTTMLLNKARLVISEKMAIVRKTSAIETLGCCMCICSDKTGTLTEGKMTVIKALAPRDDIVEAFAYFPTAGCDPTGSIFKAADLTEAAKKDIDQHIKDNGGKVTDALPLRQYGGSPDFKDIDDAHVRTLMMAASLNSYATEIQKNEAGKWVTVGNLSEGALVVGAAKAGMGAPYEGLDVHDVRKDFPADPEIEVPFSSARKMMSTVHAVPNGKFAGLTLSPGETHVCIVKGAPDRLLPKVQKTLKSKGSTLSISAGFDAKSREAVERENLQMAQDALRVLLLCVRTLTDTEVATLRTLNADERMDMVTQQLAIVGAFGILDPPRATVKASIEKCKDAGVRVVMITGDQPPTAAAIGAALGIVSDRSQAKLCTTLHNPDGSMLPNDKIDELVKSTNVWARAQPADKVTIVESLQRMGYPSAMTGDGVNDAPALKLADIGTAMGLTGTAVAKGAADIVLMNDDFTTIVAAIEEGRRTYNNVQLYVSYYVAMFLPEVVTYLTCILGGTPLPLTQIQILGMNGIAHLIPPLMFCFQPISANAMSIPPRRKDARVLPKTHLFWLVLPWIAIWAVMWSSFNCYSYWRHTGMVFSGDIAKLEMANGVTLKSNEDIMQSLNTNQNNFKFFNTDSMILSQAHPKTMGPFDLHHASRVARTMNFVTICFAEMFLCLTFASETSFGFITSPNFEMKISCVVMMSCALAGVYFSIWFPPIGRYFMLWTGLVPIDFADLGIAFCWALLSQCVIEVVKLLFMKEVDKLNDLRRYHALATSKGMLAVDATDEQVEEFRAQHPIDEVKAMV